MSSTTCIFQIPVIPLHTSIKWSSKSNLNLKSTILILQLSQYIHFPKKIYTFYPISDQESRQCHSYEVIVYYVSFWLLIIYKKINTFMLPKNMFLFWKNCEKIYPLTLLPIFVCSQVKDKTCLRRKTSDDFFCYSLNLWSLVYLMTTMTLK